MQAILFYLDVIAFLVVVYWIYGVEQRSKSTGKGLLGMNEPESGGVAAPLQPTSRWRQVEAPTGRPAAPERPAPVTPMPAWRRTLRYGQRPPKI